MQTDKLIYGRTVDKFIPSKQRLIADHYGKNYIDALLDSFIHELRFFNYDGCKRDTPEVLLYHLLRHSLSMSYWDAAAEWVTPATNLVFMSMGCSFTV